MKHILSALTLFGVAMLGLTATAPVAKAETYSVASASYPVIKKHHAARRARTTFIHKRRHYARPHYNNWRRQQEQSARFYAIAPCSYWRLPYYPYAGPPVHARPRLAQTGPRFGPRGSCASPCQQCPGNSALRNAPGIRPQVQPRPYGKAYILPYRSYR